MGILNKYLVAIKNIDKRNYLTSFLILIYFIIMIQSWTTWTNMMKYNTLGVSVVMTFIIKFLYNNVLLIFPIIFYPPAKIVVEKTGLYRAIFGYRSTWQIIKSTVLQWLGMGQDIPDDYYIHSGKRSYRIGAFHKSKAEIVSGKRAIYGFSMYIKILMIDVMGKLFFHFGIFIISPLIFLIVTPLSANNTTEG